MECLQLPRDELDCFPRHDPGRSPQQADQGVLVIEVAPDRLLQLVRLDDPGSIESLWSIDLRFGTNQDERLERGWNADPKPGWQFDLRHHVLEDLDVALVLFQRGSHAFVRSEEHTSELQSLMRISYAVFCLKKKKY